MAPTKRRKAPTATATAAAAAAAAAILSPYEVERAERIARNEAYMQSLGLGSGLAGATPAARSVGVASQRGVSKKRSRVSSEPPRRSSRQAGIVSEQVELPSNFREPQGLTSREESVRRTDDFALLADHAPAAVEDGEELSDELEAARVAAGRALEAGRCAELVRCARPGEGRAELDAAEYLASLHAMRVREVDVAKVTTNRTYSLRFHPGAERLLLAAGDSHGQIGLWDVDEPDGERCAWTFSGSHSRPVTALVWDTSKLYSGSYDSLVRCADFGCGEPRSSVVADYDEQEVGDLTHCALDLAHGSPLVWGAHNNGALSLVDTRASASTTAMQWSAHDRKVAHVALRPGAPEHLASCGNDSVVKVWDVRRLQAFEEKRVGPTPLWTGAHSKSVHGCDWSPDGLALVTVSYDDTLAFWDFSTASVSAAKSKAALASVAEAGRVKHGNTTGRYLTPFKPCFDPHSPKDDPAALVGSMQHPRAIDVLTKRNRLLSLADGEVNFRTVTSLHDVHPTRHVIAGCNNSGRLFVWRSIA